MASKRNMVPKPSGSEVVEILCIRYGFLMSFERTVERDSDFLGLHAQKLLGFYPFGMASNDI